MKIGICVARVALAVVGITVLVVASGCGSVDTESGGQGSLADATPTVLVEPTPVVVDATAPAEATVEESDTIGLPVIPPSLPVEPGKPAFTEEEAATYALAYLMVMPDPDYPPPTVLRVEFLPIAELEVRINHPIAIVPRDALLCLVTIRGTFVFDLPPGEKANVTPGPNGVLYQIYDAQTGNYIAHASGSEKVD